MAVTGAPDFDRMRWVATEVAADVERDARAFEGQAFTGRTVGELTGNMAAGIAALANLTATQLDMIEALREEVRELREWKDDHDAA